MTKVGGDHVIGELLLEGGAQVGCGEGVGGFGNEIGGQEGIAGMILACDDDGVGDIGMGGEEGLDFTEFDTEAADFDLMVEAAEVFDIAIGEIAGEIAGLVEPCAGE